MNIKHSSIIWSAMFFIGITCASCKHTTTATIDNANGQCVSGNCYNGHGTWLYPNGGRYTGGWKNGIRNGQGTDYFVSGDVYVGQFVNSARQGYGKLTMADGETYSGQWAHNLRNGQGKTVLANGEIKEGQFVNDHIVHGKVTFPSGNVYFGDFSTIKDRNYKHGKGIFTWADGSSFTGSWQKGYRVRGIYTNINGIRYNQVWQHDQIVSEEKIGGTRKAKAHANKSFHQASPIPQPTATPTASPSGRRWKKPVE